MRRSEFLLLFSFAAGGLLGLVQYAQHDEVLLGQALAIALLVFLGTIPRLLLGPKAGPFTRVVLGLLALTLLSVPLYVLAARWQNHQTQRRATGLIRQLNRYRRQHGGFPDSLAQLVPRYLPVVPTTAYGLRPPAFHYARAADAPTFELLYWPHHTVEWRYTSADGHWHVQDEND